MNNNIKKQLKKMRVSPLSRQEKDIIWKQVCLGVSAIQKGAPRKSHTVSVFKKSIAISLIFGMTAGTVFAADEAKPGDFLFPLDRAMENIQLSVVSGNKKDELKVKFALERVEEVKEIFSEITPKTKTSLKTKELPSEVIPDKPTPKKAEEETIERTSDYNIPKSESVDGPKTEETDDNPEETIATDEDSPEDLPAKQTDEGVENPPTDGETAGGKANAEIVATTIDESDDSENNNNDAPDEIIDEIDELTEILQGDVKMSDADKKRIELALGTALDFLSDVKGELAEQGNDEAAASIDNLLKDLNNEIETLPENVTFEVKLSPSKQKVKFEITSEDDKDVVHIVETPEVETNNESDAVKQPDKEAGEPKETKLEIKDGTLSIKTEGEGAPSKEERVAKEEINLPDGGSEEGVTSDEPVDKKAAEKLPEETSLESEEKADEGDEDPADAESSSEVKQKQSTTTDDVLDSATSTQADGENPQASGEDDGTTTVKVIIKKLDEDFELSVTDEDEGLHEIIEEYTDEKGGV